MIKNIIEKSLTKWYGKAIAIALLILMPLLFFISIEYHVLPLGLGVLAVLFFFVFTCL